MDFSTTHHRCAFCIDLRNTCTERLLAELLGRPIRHCLRAETITFECRVSYALEWMPHIGSGIALCLADAVRQHAYALIGQTSIPDLAPLPKLLHVDPVEPEASWYAIELAASLYGSLPLFASGLVVEVVQPDNLAEAPWVSSHAIQMHAADDFAVYRETAQRTIRLLQHFRMPPSVTGRLAGVATEYQLRLSGWHDEWLDALRLLGSIDDEESQRIRQQLLAVVHEPDATEPVTQRIARCNNRELGVAS